jgi:hypothetical protein
MGGREPRLASEDLVGELSEAGVDRLVAKPGQSSVDRAERAVIASGHTPVDLIDFASLDHRPSSLCAEQVTQCDV